MYPVYFNFNVSVSCSKKSLNVSVSLEQAENEIPASVIVDTENNSAEAKGTYSCSTLEEAANEFGDLLKGELLAQIVEKGFKIPEFK